MLVYTWTLKPAAKCTGTARLPPPHPRSDAIKDQCRCLRYSVQSLLSSRLLSRNLKVKIYKTTILPVVLYGCETWSLTIREEHRLRVFENRVMNRIFGPNRDEVTGQCTKLYSGELHNSYSPDIIRRIKSWRMWWAGHVARMGEGVTCTGFWWESPKERDRLEDQGVDGEDGIKMDLTDIGWGRGVDWIHLAQDRDRWRALVEAAMNHRVLAPRS
jgi:hypothetical protein